MQIADDVITVLEGLKFDGCNATIEQQLDRKLYVAVDEVLQACGGKWNRRAKAHVFPIDAAELVSRVIAQGSIVTASEMGFFATPAVLSASLVEAANVTEDSVVLEPSAGSGRILDALIDQGVRHVIAVELDQKRARALKGFYTANWGYRVEEMDFLDFVADEPIDAVVMNPPFGKVGKGDHLDHIDHAYGMLAKGGTLVSVLPAGVKFRSDKRTKAFRSRFSHGTIEDLPDDAFKESGTKVRTVMLKVTRP